MTEFEYFSAVIAVILALGVTHLLGQIGLIAQDRGAVRHHWIPSTWIVVVLMAHFFAWWNIWELKDSIRFTFPTFLYMLIGPTALFLAARTIVPPIRGSQTLDLERHYFSVYRLFFVLMAIFTVWPSLLGIVLLGTASIRGVLEHSAFLVPILACAVSPSRRLHAFVSVLVAGGFLAVALSGVA